jgi:hypothetical protein
MNNNNNNKSHKRSRPKNPKRGNGTSAKPKHKRAKAEKQDFAAASYATGQHSQPPSVVRSSVGSCRIRHRELVASISGSISYAVSQSFDLNPGLVASFPWLSIEAQGWETYHFNSLKYEYYTRTGTSTPGSVILAPDYDAADAAPVSEQIASSYADAEEDAPWKDMVCILNEKGLAGGVTKKFVRTNPLLPPNQDIKTFDSGTMFICTTDGTGTSWGKLWVEYDVTFWTPQLPAVGPVFSAGGSILGGGTMTPTAPLGSAPVINVNNQGFSNIGSNVIFFTNTGQYLVTIQGNGTGVSGLPTTANAGCVAQALTTAAVNTAGTLCEQTFIVAVTVPNATISINVTATTVTGYAIFVGSAPGGSL